MQFDNAKVVEKGKIPYDRYLLPMENVTVPIFTAQSGAGYIKFIENDSRLLNITESEHLILLRQKYRKTIFSPDPSNASETMEEVS